MEKSRALTVIALLAVLGCTWYLVAMERDGTTTPPMGDQENSLAATRPDLSVRPDSRTRETVLPRAATSQPSAAVSPPVSEPGILEGIVVGTDGAPRQGVRLAFLGFDMEAGRRGPEASSDPLGRFRFEVEGPREGQMRVLDPELVGVLVPRLYGGVPESELRNLTVLVAERRPLKGRVLDQDGRPVAGASVSMQSAVDLRARVPRNFDRCETRSITAQSGDDGSFGLEDAYAIPEALLHPAKEGYIGMPAQVPEATRGIVLVLHRIQKGDVLRGTVVGANDRAVPNAEVALGNLTTRSDASGAFALDLGAVHTLAPLDRPVLIAFGPEPSLGRLEARGPEWRRRDSWPPDLVVRLGTRLPEIAGHVEDADGKRVDLCEATLLDVREPELVSRLEMYRDDVAFATGIGLRDGATGFRLTCPEAGFYRVRIRVPQKLLVHVSEAIRAGTQDAVIRLPREDAWPPLRLVVVDPRGVPVVGADAVVQASAAASEGTSPWSTEILRTDAQGLLQIPAFSRAAERLLVKATELADFEVHQIAQLVRGATTRVVIPRACQARVELVNPHEDVDSVAFEDASQRPLHPVVTSGNARFGSPSVHLQAGRSWVFTLSEGAVIAHVKKAGKTLRSTKVALSVETVNVLRL